MGSVIPRRRNVSEFGDSGDDHDGSGNGATKCRGGPRHGSGRELLIVRRVDLWRVVRSEEEVGGDVQDPDTIEVDEKMCK